MIPSIVNNQLGGYARELLAAWRFQTKTLRTHQDKFVLFGRGRSGSTLLMDLIASSDEVSCDKEIFNRKVLFPRMFLKHRNQIFLNRVYGFKLLSYQLKKHYNWSEAREFLNYLVNEKGYKVIYISRDNPVRQTLSKHYARFRGSWHESNAFDTPKMKVDVPSFLSELRAGVELDHFESYCLKDLKHFKVSYERDLGDSSRQLRLMDRLSFFLGIRFRRPQTKFRKISAAEVSEFVSNWKDLKSCLAYTEFARYI